MSADRRSYFDALRETSRAVLPLVLNTLDELRSGSSALFSAAYSPLLGRFQEGALLQKATLFRLTFEAAGGQSWKRYAAVAAAVEVLNLATYLSNLGLDGKGHANSLEQRCDQFLAATTCREASSRLVGRELRNHTDTLQALEVLSEVNSAVHFGQHLDLHAEATANFLESCDLATFEARYEERCRALSGAFNAAICELAARLAKAPLAQVVNLRTFGTHFGIGLQMVNDVADCTPAHWEDRLAKDYQGNFADLGNGRLTLAPAHCLTVARTALRTQLLECFASTELKDPLKDQISSALWESGSISYARRQVLRHFRVSKRRLRPLPETQHRRLLGTLASVLSCNKYWRAWNRRFRPVSPSVSSPKVPSL